MKDAGIALGVFCLLAVSVVGIMHFEDEQNKAFLRITEEQRLLADREIYEYRDTDAQGVVSYTYLGEPLPEKLVEHEVVERRSENSVHRVVRVIDDKHQEVQGIFYALPIQAKDEKGVWRKLEEATTTESAWRLRPESLKEKTLAFLMPIAHAFTILSGAGWIQSDGNSGTTCGNARALATAGGSVSASSGFPLTVGVYLDDHAGPGCDAQFFRGAIPIDTSSIPSAFPITSASLTINVTAAIDTYGNGTSFRLVPNTQVSSASLAASDFTLITGVNLSTTDYFLPATGSHTFTVAAGELGRVKRSGEVSLCGSTNGVTCWAVKHQNESIAGISDATNGFEEITIGGSGTYMTSNYVASSFAFWQFQDF